MDKSKWNESIEKNLSVLQMTAAQRNRIRERIQEGEKMKRLRLKCPLCGWGELIVPIAVVLGGLCVAGMLLLQFPYAVMIGVFIGFTALIPIAGAYIGAAVGAIMILAGSPLQADQFLVFVVVLQQIEGNLIYPKVVGQSIGLPGIWVLTAITIGGGVLGIGGMLIAVPLFAAAYRLLKEDVEKRNPTTDAFDMEEDVEEDSKDIEESEAESIFVDEDKHE